MLFPGLRSEKVAPAEQPSTLIMKCGKLLLKRHFCDTGLSTIVEAAPTRYKPHSCNNVSLKPCAKQKGATQRLRFFLIFNSITVPVWKGSTIFFNYLKKY